jgi:hypothetical protein
MYNPDRKATAAQFHANRSNSKSSTGPRSENGKQTSAMNGFKHGLTGQRMILQEHETEPYRRLTNELRAQYLPATEIENQLVQHIIDCNMRLNRAAAIDCNLLNVGLADNIRSNAIHDEVTESVIAQTRAWVKQADSFEKLGRYEARISRQLLRYMHELEHVQNLRKSQQPIDQPAVGNQTQPNESNHQNHQLASLRTNPPHDPRRDPQHEWVPTRVPRVMTAKTAAPTLTEAA